MRKACWWVVQHSEALIPLYRESLGIVEYLPKLEDMFFLSCFAVGLIHTITMTRKKKIGERRGVKCVFGGPASLVIHIDIYSQAASRNPQTVVSNHSLGGTFVVTIHSC